MPRSGWPNAPPKNRATAPTAGTQPVSAIQYQSRLPRSSSTSTPHPSSARVTLVMTRSTTGPLGSVRRMCIRYPPVGGGTPSIEYPRPENIRDDPYPQELYQDCV